MKFEIVRGSKIGNAKERYFIKERSFDCNPSVNVDINIAMAYLNLGVDSEDMCVKCLWGFSPRESWKEANLFVPSAIEGELRLVGEYEAGLMWRIDKNKMWESYVWENEKILKYRLGVIKEMIDSYISDMTDYIAPENETAMMRVDRNDIWWNYKQIEGEATSFDWMVQDTGSTLATYKRLFIPNPFSSDEENEAKKSAQQQEEDAESARRQRNYEKLQGFRDQLDTSIREKISDSVDEIRKIYENKVIPFENTDDSYKSKMSAYYSEWSSMGDKFSDAGNAIRDFLAGIGDSLVDTVKGLLTLVVDLGILYVDVRWKSIVPIQVPEVLDQEVEKIKQKYEPLLKDPVNTIGGIGQSICDTADEKGVAYSSGYIVTEVVTALLADKGLDKIKNVAKTGKTADNVADIAEGAAKGAGNAAEDAGKAGKGLEEAAKGAESAAEDAGKVVESGLNSNLLDELVNSGVKYNPEDIVAITKTADGKLVWLENGTDTAGLNHIITEHADDFLNKGITQEQIPDYVMNALENGKIVGYQGRGTGRPIYEFTYNGEIHKVAITVGNNGFIVGANPK